jgi:peptidoglycan/LPS O-acetylase OafA/YrhL
VNPAPRFVALDSWRGICACLVAMFHLTEYTLILDIPFIRNAFLFVDFFFVLSGFVITASYAERLANGFGVMNFMMLRTGRVYPLHLFMLLLFILFTVLNFGLSAQAESQIFALEKENPYAIITNLLLIHSLGLHDSLTWNFPSWSISTEYYAYLFFALAITIFRRGFFVLMLAVVVLGPVLVAAFSPDNMATSYDYGFIRCLYGFGVGSLFWWIYKNYLHDKKASALEEKYKWTAIEAITVINAVMFVHVAGISVISVIAPLVFCMVIYAFIYEAGYISRLLLSKNFVIIGTLSYSIYMIHAFILVVETRLFAAVQRNFGIDMFRNIDGISYLGGNAFASAVVYVATMALIIGCAFLTYRGIEAPGRDLFRRIVKARGNA